MILKDSTTSMGDESSGTRYEGRVNLEFKGFEVNMVLVDVLFFAVDFDCRVPRSAFRVPGRFSS